MISEPETPEKFGKYIVLDAIGEGGMSYVWKAWDPDLNQEVAIKELKRDLLSRPFNRLLQAEAQVIRSLNHPAIVTVYDFVAESERGTPYFVMEYMPNGPLGGAIHPLKCDPPECIKLLRPIAAALDDAHEERPPYKKRIVHSDVKPGNILFDREDHPHLSDFGIAWWDDTVDGYQSSADAPLSGETFIHPFGSSQDSFRGTLEYAAPELFRRQQPTVKSDIYSLAVVAFEMLTGQLPVVVKRPEPSGDAEADQLRLFETYQKAHAEATTPDITQYGRKGQFHNRYKKVFERAFNKRPDRRYKTATAFIDALEEAMVKGPEDVPVKIRELPALLLGRTGEGTEGASAKAYQFMRRRGGWALMIWLVVTIGTLWASGRFDPLLPYFQEGSYWDAFSSDRLLNGRLLVLSVRLLSNWVYAVALSVLLILFLLSRLMAWVASRAASDRFWKGTRRQELRVDLIAHLKDSYKEVPDDSEDSLHNCKFLILDEVDMRLRLYDLGIREKQEWPAHLTKGKLAEGVDKIIADCDAKVTLWRLRTKLDAKLAKGSPVSYPNRRAQTILTGLEIIFLATYFLLVLLALPVAFYLAKQPGYHTTFQIVSGMIALCLMGAPALWFVLRK